MFRSGVGVAVDNEHRGAPRDGTAVRAVRTAPNGGGPLQSSLCLQQRTASLLSSINLCTCASSPLGKLTSIAVARPLALDTKYSRARPWARFVYFGIVFSASSVLFKCLALRLQTTHQYSVSVVFGVRSSLYNALLCCLNNVESTGLCGC